MKELTITLADPIADELREWAGDIGVTPEGLAARFIAEALGMCEEGDEAAYCRYAAGQTPAAKEKRHDV